MTITVIPMTMINILAWINEKTLMKIISFFMKKNVCLEDDLMLNLTKFDLNTNKTTLSFQKFYYVNLFLIIFLVLWIDDLPKLL